MHRPDCHTIALIVLGLLGSSIMACSNDAARDSDIQLDASGSDTDVSDAGGLDADAESADATSPDAEDADASSPDADTSRTFPTPPPTTLGGERPAAVTLPDDYAPDRAWPVVLLLHGFGATGSLQAAYWGTRSQVDALGFILIIPEGTTNSDGDQFWDAWPICCNREGADVDDVAYLSSLLDQAEAAYNVDSTRIYAVGHSNGGYMSYRLACELGNRLAGIMSLAGAMPGNLESCADNGAVSVLQVHGTEDEAVPYETDVFRTGALDSVAFWAERAGCTSGPEDTGRMNLVIGAFAPDDTSDPDETRISEWDGCTRDVELWTLEGVDHIPAFEREWSERWLRWLFDRPGNGQRTE
jgi:polyhydroxybutyrate depolymerase